MSARKNNLLKYKSISAGDMSATSITSDVTNIQFLDNLGYQFSWTGSPVGTFSLEVSADYAQDDMSPPNVQNVGHWTPITFTYWDSGTSQFITGTTIPTSVGSPIYLDLALLSAPWIRAVYTKGSGTGTLTAYITGKMV